MLEQTDRGGTITLAHVLDLSMAEYWLQGVVKNIVRKTDALCVDNCRVCYLICAVGGDGCSLYRIYFA